MIIRGIVPPIVTPISADDHLDLIGLEQLIGRMLDAKVHGLFVLGTTGEGPGLSAKLRREVVAQSRKLTSSHDLPVYVGITDTSLVESVNLAKFAADVGATAVVAAPPFYFPAGQTELRHWFTLLAEQSPLPLILYNMPSCVKIDIELETLKLLLQHPNIVGLKDSSGDINYLRAAIEVAQLRPNWPVLVGPEALLVQAMSLGAVGGVAGGANLCPQLFTDLFDAIERQDTHRIDRLQAIVIELQQLYQMGKYGSSYLKGLKCALELTKLCSGALAPPYDAFKSAERQRVSEWLDSFCQHGYLPDLDRAKTQG